MLLLSCIHVQVALPRREALSKYRSGALTARTLHVGAARDLGRRRWKEARALRRKRYWQTRCWHLRRKRCWHLRRKGCWQVVSQVEGGGKLAAAEYVHYGRGQEQSPDGLHASLSVTPLYACLSRVPPVLARLLPCLHMPLSWASGASELGAKTRRGRPEGGRPAEPGAATRW